MKLFSTKAKAQLASEASTNTKHMKKENYTFRFPGFLAGVCNATLF